MKTASSRHADNFDFIRFAAAVTVWYAHCLTFYGFKQPTSFEYPGRFAVDVFFVVSGYFITASYLKHPNLPIYFRNRFLRIFPALAVVVSVSALVLGPLATSLDFHRYFSSSGTWRYLKWMLVFTRQSDSLPGVFDHNASSEINFSLWTLHYEGYCYLMIGLFGIFGMLRPRYIVAAFVVLWLLRAYCDPFADLAAKFLCGAFLCVTRGKIPFHKRYVLASLIVMYISSAWWQNHLLFDLAFAYGIIGCGFLTIPVLRNFGKYGDFSYGMYLYAFPIQQLLLYRFGHVGFYFFLFASFILTFACAFLSWRCIERPALKLKRH